MLTITLKNAAAADVIFSQTTPWVPKGTMLAALAISPSMLQPTLTIASERGVKVQPKGLVGPITVNKQSWLLENPAGSDAPEAVGTEERIAHKEMIRISRSVSTVQTAARANDSLAYLRELVASAEFAEMWVNQGGIWTEA